MDSAVLWLKYHKIIKCTPPWLMSNDLTGGVCIFGSGVCIVGEWTVSSREGIRDYRLLQILLIHLQNIQDIFLKLNGIEILLFAAYESDSIYDIPYYH